MHEALVGTGRKRMRALGRDGGFGGHAGVADAVGAGHGGQFEPLGHVAGQAHLLVDLDPVAVAHDPASVP
jgi:hypothetical protein